MKLCDLGQMAIRGFDTLPDKSRSARIASTASALASFADPPRVNALSTIAIGSASNRSFSFFIRAFCSVVRLSLRRLVIFHPVSDIYFEIEARYDDNQNYFEVPERDSSSISRSIILIHHEGSTSISDIGFPSSKGS